MIKPLSKYSLHHITSTRTMHSHLLTRLSCTLLSLLSLSRALPSPQDPSEPPSITNVVPLSPGSPLAGAAPITFTDLSGNALNSANASDDVMDGVDLTNFVFNPLQMPTETGPSESETVKAFQPLTLPSTAKPSVAVDSALTSRSISDSIIIQAKTGSFITRNNETAYSFAVNATAMKQLFADATAYALAQFNSGNLRGNESDQNYYRFTSQNLTIAAIVYGEAGTGDEPFNWGDFSLITGFLTNLTIKHPNNNLTWNGGMTMEDGSRGVDFFVVPSFGDILDSSPTPPPAASTPSYQPGGADGGLRLAKRATAVDLGVDNVRMTIRKATSRVMTGMLYSLASTALDTLLADSGQNPSYREFIQRSCEPIMRQYHPNQIMQIVATNQVVSRDVIFAALQALVQLTYESSMNAGSARTLYGELIIQGTTIARWSLGAAIGGPPCVVFNPDGSMALGCLIRNF